ncbi:MAG: hypothetical protein QF442_03555 [Candidatus Peribacteraceae bacterium]|jgi:hypothetical protein|nr:hypothetical protein [Candidatus Peribacteraceae bacterium]
MSVLVALVLFTSFSKTYGDTPSLNSLKSEKGNSAIRQYAAEYGRKRQKHQVEAVTVFLKAAYQLDEFETKKVEILDDFSDTLQRYGVRVKSSPRKNNLLVVKKTVEMGTSTTYEVTIENGNASDKYIQKMALLMIELDSRLRRVWTDVKSDKIDAKVTSVRTKKKGVLQFTISYTGGNFQFAKSVR